MKEIEKAIDSRQMQPGIPKVTCCKPRQQASDLCVFNADMLWGMWRTAKTEPWLYAKKISKFSCVFAVLHATGIYSLLVKDVDLQRCSNSS